MLFLQPGSDFAGSDQVSREGREGGHGMHDNYQ